MAGIIDFGDLCAGDPAVDFAVGWMLFDDRARDLLRRCGGADAAMWRRRCGHVAAGTGVGVGAGAGTRGQPRRQQSLRRAWCADSARGRRHPRSCRGWRSVQKLMWVLLT
ncbi:MAG: phosphotransferase [Candidatus Nanopelagicales bacterium]